LLGAHQRVNAALALATERVLHNQIAVDERALRTGLKQVRWPGRMEVHTTADGQTILVDGAHNPAGAQSLRDALARYFPGEAPTLILGIMKDKDWATMCQILVPVSARVILAPVQSERTASATELQLACSTILPQHQTIACSSLKAALELAQQDRFVLITGSLHFVGEAMELLHLLPAVAGERNLNEWDAGARTHPSPAGAVP
jgi:dihydrofolate synthase/folylpolyglutamate synthase